MNKLACCLLCVVVIIGLLLTSVAAKELRIGVVDIESIINNSPEYKRIEGSLKKKSEELGRPLQQREQELGQQIQEFQKQAQAGIIKDEARKRKESEFQQKIDAIQKSRDTAAKSFQEYYQQAMKPLMEKMNKAVALVAEQENLDIIFPKAGTYVRDKSLDVTEKVRAAFK
jgi:outer membrane protein|uniref:OmpH family outer membrane protein n=1 Tax=Desulfobacca acetoxidans TaxID=60893 RepID=A0A7V6A451_9BACT